MKRHHSALPFIMRAALPLLLVWPSLRHLIESRMATHMLIEFPLLLAAGVALEHGLSRRALPWRMRFGIGALDRHGLIGATSFSIVAALWMVPALLDLSLVSAPMAAFKYVGWLLAGYAIAGGWPRMDDALRLYVLGNFAWMSATAGLLYLDTPQRLCVSYLQGDQRMAGIGLVLAACAAGVIALRLSTAQAPLAHRTESTTSA